MPAEYASPAIFSGTPGDVRTGKREKRVGEPLGGLRFPANGWKLPIASSAPLSCLVSCCFFRGTRCDIDGSPKGTPVPRIVVIDDEAHLRRFYQIWLSMAGHDVVTVADPREAVEVVLREQPDLIVLDVLMPKVSGPDIERSLREHPATKSIPVLFVAGKVADADLWAPYWDGVLQSGRPYLMKPFPPGPLQDAVERLLHCDWSSTWRSGPPVNRQSRSPGSLEPET